MTIEATWDRGGGTASIEDVAAFDAWWDALPASTNDALPYCVSLVITAGSDFPPMLEFCIGHAERSFVYQLAADGTGAWGYQPDLEPGPAFVFDYAGTTTDAWPERTRVAPPAARAAARQFIATAGHRSTSCERIAALFQVSTDIASAPTWYYRRPIK